MITFWISAITSDDKPREHIMRHVDAIDFEHAQAMLRREAREKWPTREWRETSVTEQPDENAGVALMLDITAAHRASRSDGKLQMVNGRCGSPEIHRPPLVPGATASEVPA